MNTLLRKEITTLKNHFSTFGNDRIKRLQHQRKFTKKKSMAQLIRSIYNVCYQEKKVSDREQMVAVIMIGSLMVIPLIVLSLII